MVLGLDFGTHQSKVCVENDSDPRDIRYTFHEFSTPEGKRSFFLPSVVQINDDETISYGFCDPQRAKEIGAEYLLNEPQPPQPINKPQPIPIPVMPSKRGYPPEDIFFERFLKRHNAKRLNKKKRPLEMKEIQGDFKEKIHAEYLERVNSVELENAKEQARWENTVKNIEARNKKNLQEYERAVEKAQKDYEKAVKRWEQSLRPRYATYRYFKISTFSRECPWNEDISARELSIWYLTYLFFSIKDSLKDITRVQMGIPQSIRDKQLSSWQTQTAKDVFYAAWNLMERVKNLDSFLSLKVSDLQGMVRTFGMTADDCEHAPGFLVLPEAFASLESITSQSKLNSTGLHLLVDIGGGSTDISLFYVNNKNKPNISAIVSVHKGLNYIFRLYRKEHPDMSMEQIREVFQKRSGQFAPQIQQFFCELNKAVDERIFTPLMNFTLSANLPLDRLKECLMNRPVIFAGGGGVYDIFHRGIHYFQDPLSISRDLLSVKNITNKKMSQGELAILSIAYGLSIPQRHCPEMVPIDEFYKGVEVEAKKHSPDYSLDDND